MGSNKPSDTSSSLSLVSNSDGDTGGKVGLGLGMGGAMLLEPAGSSRNAYRNEDK